MNNISWHNYETFFLRYVDNELPDAERKEVEEFAQTHPDLQEELALLQQTVLKDDIIVFDDKKNLFIKDNIPASLQDKLLSCLDNELTAAERNEIDGLLKTDIDIKKEWDILQQTKLLPGRRIVFKDKRSLYRKEDGKVVAFPWWKLAVAAVFIGFGVWGGLVYLKKDTVTNGTEFVNKGKTKPGTVKPVVRQAITPVAVPVVKEKDIATTSVNAKKPTAGVSPQLPKKPVHRAVPNRDIQNIAVHTKDNNLPAPSSDNVNNIGGNKTITAYVTPGKQPDVIVNPGDNDIHKNTATQVPVNTYATTTSYADNNEDNNNRVLFMDEEKIKKTKLGGIFRKVKRVLERKANIKPGGDNNIKVANLEFAIQ